ncbi:GTP-binding protein [Xanthomarina sp. F2636L]|uniref:GTP-binding protein n=1 Tax=Xanthomarina sp. F2636L TaxID=2996018 RepID=UPI00225E308A|nr:GTP-binding protein [Xanthomarina sp. F2636L]MCX7552078.1 GTP-binding protein [Xanthomarina sp. F2636L]
MSNSSTINEVVLRPRFKFEKDRNNEDLLSLFDKAKKEQSNFIVSRIDNHVFLKLPKQKQHFWSPQLHLEIDEINENSSTIRGLFGPNPTVWTMFMFFHFLVGCLFLGFGAWGYSNWSLETSYGIQISMMIFMVIVWIVLYFVGQMGKKVGMNDMHLLHRFMRDTLRNQ